MRGDNIRLIIQPNEILDDPFEVWRRAININDRIPQLIFVTVRIRKKVINIFFAIPSKDWRALCFVEVSQDQPIQRHKSLAKTKFADLAILWFSVTQMSAHHPFCVIFVELGALYMNQSSVPSSVWRLRLIRLSNIVET